ncbi:MAG: glycosyltransferase [Flavobacteriales bacterium]|nr:glycosyltransferase [Flavobacteriales bacterium]
MHPKVSIVVTCYNLGSYLPEALESIEAYSPRTDIEVIIVDDGSTDEATNRVLDALDTERYRVIRQQNTGLGKARNNGIRVARGEYIIPLDADNQLFSAQISRTIELLDSDPGIDVVYGDLQYFGEHSGRILVGPFNFGRMYRKNYIDACAGFRKSLWERLGGYDEHMPVMGFEDWDFWLRASVSGARFRYVPEVFFNYRVRHGSMLTHANVERSRLVEYIFNKPELRFLHDLRLEHMRLLEIASKPPLTGREHLAMAKALLWERLRKR